MGYKSCIVPQCTNTSIKNPQKLFVSVPTNPKRREKWLQLSRRDPKSISPHSNVFMCEDHFDMEKDIINYMKYKMGFSQKMLLSNEAVPTKFHCQDDRKRWQGDPEPSREVFHKRQKVNIATEYLQRQNATEIHTESLQKDDNMIQEIIKSEESPKTQEKLPNDMENYMEYHIMGSVSRVRMKPGCIPTKFSSPFTRKRGNNRKLPNILRKKKNTTTKSGKISAGSSTESADNTSLEASWNQSNKKRNKMHSALVKDLKTGKSKNVPYCLTDYTQLSINSPNSRGGQSDDMVEEYLEDDPLSVPDSSENTYRTRLSTSCSANTPPLDKPTSPMSSPSSPQSFSSNEPHMNSSNVNRTIIEYFNAKKAKLNQKETDLTEDPRKMFLLSLLPDLKMMSDAQMRDFKRSVLALVDEILHETPRDPVNSSQLHECKQEVLSNDSE